MRRESALERELAFKIKLAGLPEPVREYRFFPGRLWRFDFCWARQGKKGGWTGVAAETEGGTYSNGRHTRGKGFEADCEKYNAAILDGWRVFRFTGEMVKDGTAIETLRKALEAVR